MLPKSGPRRPAPVVFPFPFFGVCFRSFSGPFPALFVLYRGREGDQEKDLGRGDPPQRPKNKKSTPVRGT